MLLTIIAFAPNFASIQFLKKLHIPLWDVFFSRHGFEKCDFKGDNDGFLNGKGGQVSKWTERAPVNQPILKRFHFT